MPIRVPRAPVPRERVGPLSETPVPRYKAEEMLGRHLSEMGARMTQAVGAIAGIKAKMDDLAARRQEAADKAQARMLYFQFRAEMDEDHTNYLRNPSPDRTYLQDWDTRAKDKIDRFMGRYEPNARVRDLFLDRLDPDMLAYRAKVQAASNARLFQQTKENLLQGQDEVRKALADPTVPFEEAAAQLYRHYGDIREAHESGVLDPLQAHALRKDADKLLESRLETQVREDPDAIIEMERATEGRPKKIREIYKDILGMDRWSYWRAKADEEKRRIEREMLALENEQRLKAERETKMVYEREVSDLIARATLPEENPNRLTEAELRAWQAEWNSKGGPHGNSWVQDTDFLRILGAVQKPADEGPSDSRIFNTLQLDIYTLTPRTTMAQLGAYRRAFTEGKPGLNRQDFEQLYTALRQNILHGRDEAKSDIRRNHTEVEQWVMETFPREGLLPSPLDDTMRQVRAQARREFWRRSPATTGQGSVQDLEKLGDQIIRKYLPQITNSAQARADVLRRELNFPGSRTGRGGGMAALEEQERRYVEFHRSRGTQPTPEEIRKLRELKELQREIDRMEAEMNRPRGAN